VRINKLFKTHYNSKMEEKPLLLPHDNEEIEIVKDKVVKDKVSKKKVKFEDTEEKSFWDKYKTYLFGVVVIALVYVSYLYFFVNVNSDCFGPSSTSVAKSPLEPFFDQSNSIFDKVNKEVVESVGNLTKNTVQSVQTSVGTVVESVTESVKGL